MQINNNNNIAEILLRKNNVEILQFNTRSIIYLKYNVNLLTFMIPLHEIVIKITQPTSNYSYTAIISEAGDTTSKLLGTIRISVSEFVRSM